MARGRSTKALLVRIAALLSVLGGSGAFAHVVPFDFVAPSGVGQKTQDDRTALQWVDGMDPQGLASLQFFASRSGLPPDAPAPRDVALSDAGIPVGDPSNLFEWQTASVAPGCYQPFAVMQDSVEGETVRPSRGVVLVRPSDGGNEPPALWVVTPPDETLSDAGTLLVRVKVVDADDVGQLTLSWTRGDAGGVLAGPFPVPDGGGLLTYPLPRSALPDGVSFLRAEVVSFDGRRCAVWWPGVLDRPLVDGGTADAGSRDAGTPDAGAPSDAGDPGPAPKGCGCGTAGLWPCVALLWFVSRRARGIRTASRAAGCGSPQPQ